MKMLVLVLMLGVLSGCGGDSAETTEAPAPAPKANNPLANQQQAIRDAAAVQGILDKNAEEKKKAIDSSN